MRLRRSIQYSLPRHRQCSDCTEFGSPTDVKQVASIDSDIVVQNFIPTIVCAASHLVIYKSHLHVDSAYHQI